MKGIWDWLGQLKPNQTGFYLKFKAPEHWADFLTQIFYTYLLSPTPAPIHTDSVGLICCGAGVY